MLPKVVDVEARPLRNENTFCAATARMFALGGMPTEVGGVEMLPYRGGFEELVPSLWLLKLRVSRGR